MITVHIVNAEWIAGSVIAGSVLLGRGCLKEKGAEITFLRGANNFKAGASAMHFIIDQLNGNLRSSYFGCSER